MLALEEESIYSLPRLQITVLGGGVKNKIVSKCFKMMFVLNLPARV